MNGLGSKVRLHLFTAFLLVTSQILTNGEELRHAAVSSAISFSFKPCKPENIYKIYHDSKVTIFIRCSSSHQIPDKYVGRISINESAGYVTIHNVAKSDGGLYTLIHKNGGGGTETQRLIRYVIHDKVWISWLSRNDTNDAISFTVGCAGDPERIVWTMDGEDLPDGHWLSDGNQTLTVLYNVTGNYTVNASNLVSVESKNITVIEDCNGEQGHLSPKMYQTITKVIWSEDGGRPDDHTLVVPRNVTILYIVRLSETSQDHKPRDRLFLLEPLLVMPVAVILVAFVRRKKIFRES
ncbi:uncharacterized protein RB166_013802 [Leptodactylus fuscus]|uniref:uncharacterized protein LOC142213413 n=1 Tax=Leptodactylus fuscus TaxID=238119 RepID=UPI003F4E8239